VANLTADELAQLAAWFETAELPPVPFRTAPWVEIPAEPDEWRRRVLVNLHYGITGLHWHTALIGVRWLAKRIAPPDVQASHGPRRRARPAAEAAVLSCHSMKSCAASTLPSASCLT